MSPRVPIEFPKFRSAAGSVARLAGIALVTLGLSSAGISVASANDKYAGLVIDANNGKVLYEDRADEQRYPASLTKMMTLYMLFGALETKRATLKTPMPVSSYAAGRPPSKLGVKAGSTLPVEDAIFSLVTRSANDVSVVIAEFLAGTEERFARAMTEQARKLGMSRTTFKNANGLPNSGQVTTARDMARLGIALREHFPQYYKYFSTRSYTYRGQRIGNHNRVLGRVKGADGIKTGYINASGFNLVSSVQRDGKSIVAVVMGGRSGRSRDDHMVDLISRTLPNASVRKAGPLVASFTPTVSSYGVPATAPVPQPRPIMTAATEVAEVAPTTAVSAPTDSVDPISARIAMAYGSDAGASVAASSGAHSPRGLHALAAALVADRPMSQAAPTISVSYASEERSQIDARATGSLNALRGEEQTARSAWVVQIAAMPGAADAMKLLDDARQKVGGPLGAAQPFTEQVRTNGHVLHRARFAGFQTKSEAWEACEALKKSSYNCYAVAN